MRRRRPLPDSPARRWLAARTGIMLTMVLVTVAGLLGALGGMGRIDLTLYDRAVSLSGRPASPEILIVMIDDDSIATLGRWPWSRTVHAALLDKLGEARAVGLDIIFAEPDRAEPAVDAQLAEAIRRNGKVVLPVVLNRLPRATGHEPPLESLAQAAAALGFINVELDTDGVLRRSIWTAQVGTALWPHFSLSLMSVGSEAQQALQFATAQLAAGQTRIPYAGPPGHLRTVSYISVLQGNVPPEWIRGKYVLVGSWATGLTDAFPTPVSHQANGMAGVEIIGNMLQAARQNISYTVASPWHNALAAALPVLLLCLGLRVLSPKAALVLNGAILLAVLPATYLALRFGQVWFPPTATMLVLALCYPIWSWRSQEAVLRYMDNELKRLQREYPPVLNEGRTHTLLVNRSLEDRLGKLREALARVRNLRRFLTDGLDGMPDATLVFDPRGRLQFRNRAAIQYFRSLGLRAPRHGQLAADLFQRAITDERNRQTLTEALRHTPPDAQDSPWNVDMEVRDQAGRDLILKCAPIRTDEGAFAGTVATLTDITVIRQAERKREETLRFISHDMRAPQNSILALVAMNQDSLNGVQQSDALARIAMLANRTLRLVDDFVHLTRAESMKIAPTELDLSELLREATDDFWAPARARGIRIEIAEPLPIALVRGDDTLLQRALSNLLDNAIKFSPSDGRIRCTVVRDADDWVASIQDDGPGIAPQDQLQIFQPFTRVNTAGSNEVGGAGLGLAFVRTVAERLGGRAEVISPPSGTGPAGSTFVLRLPASPPPG
ncbi:CHASE2 domain-containing protein [Bordetella bronchiseptica]|uniref:CHASE2 domain-containing protein n=1 Tax=Bordetella bronchiseptica TaxID=518 RepID=UPI00403D4069